MIIAGPAAAVTVTEVGRVESQGVLRLRIGCLEVVTVETLVSVLDAAKDG